VFVMEPAVQNIGPPGNVARNLPAVRQQLLGRILAIVRESFPAAQAVEPGDQTDARPLPGYPVVGRQVAAWVELDAARRAYERGANFLLVPDIVDWKESRTDDPIGVFTAPHDAITVTLRLMALRPPALAGSVTFSNRDRTTLNRPAIHLLNDRFRQVVLQLLAGHL